MLSLTTGQEVPGIAQWRQQVKDVIKEERRLEKDAKILKEGREPATKTPVTANVLEETKEKSAEITLKKSQTTPSNVDPSKFKDLLQTVIKRFLTKVEKKKENKASSKEENISSKLLSLLSQSKKSKTKKTNNNSYLDKLLQTYESRDDYENYIRRNEYDSQFDNSDILSEYLEKPRFSGRSFSTFDLYEDDPYSFFSRSGSLYNDGINEALLESRLLDRELRGLLRRIED